MDMDLDMCRVRCKVAGGVHPVLTPILAFLALFHAREHTATVRAYCVLTCYIRVVAHLECLAEREAFNVFGSLPLSNAETNTNPSALQLIQVL